MKYIVSYRVAADICHWCDLDWLQTLLHCHWQPAIFQDNKLSKHNFEKTKVNALIGNNYQLIHGSSVARQGISHEKTPNNEPAKWVLKYRLAGPRAQHGFGFEVLLNDVQEV